MDPYSRAPRSPKSKQQTSKVFFDTGMTTGPQVEDCKSPSVEQVELNIMFRYMYNWPFGSVYFRVRFKKFSFTLLTVVITTFHNPASYDNTSHQIASN